MSVNEWLAIISYLFLLFWPLEIISALNMFFTLFNIKKKKRKKKGEVILFLNMIMLNSCCVKLVWGPIQISASRQRISRIMATIISVLMFKKIPLPLELHYGGES